MKQIVMAVCVLLCTGCVSSMVEEQTMKVKAQIATEISQTHETIKSEYTRDMKASEDRLRAEFATKIDELKKEADVERETHQKTMKEVNLSLTELQKEMQEADRTLIDVQKDLFQNRRITEENARRVYIIESLVAATRTQIDEKTEGQVLALKDGAVTTSLGTKQGIKAGDLLAVFKDETSKEKLATLKVLVAEATESKSEIVTKTADVARGNLVKPEAVPAK